MVNLFARSLPKGDFIVDFNGDFVDIDGNPVEIPMEVGENDFPKWNDPAEHGWILKEDILPTSRKINFWIVVMFSCIAMVMGFLIAVAILPITSTVETLMADTTAVGETIRMLSAKADSVEDLLQKEKLSRVFPGWRTLPEEWIDSSHFVSPDSTSGLVLVMLIRQQDQKMVHAIFDSGKKLQNESDEWEGPSSKTGYKFARLPLKRTWILRSIQGESLSLEIPWPEEEGYQWIPIHLPPTKTDN